MEVPAFVRITSGILKSPRRDGEGSVLPTPGASLAKLRRRRMAACQKLPLFHFGCAGFFACAPRGLLVPRKPPGLYFIPSFTMDVSSTKRRWILQFQYDRSAKKTYVTPLPPETVEGALRGFLIRMTQRRGRRCRSRRGSGLRFSQSYPLARSTERPGLHLI